MDITDMLAAPDGAVLVAIGGEVALVTVRRMGPAVPVRAVLELIGGDTRTQGMTSVETAPPPLLTQDGDTVACPQCGKRCVAGRSLSIHIRKAHTEREMAPCMDCGFIAKTKTGLSTHMHRMHPGQHASGTVAPVPAADLSRGQIAPGAVARTAKPADPRGMCETCGAPNRNHLQCHECGRRIGTGHTVAEPAQRSYGKTYCGDCLEIIRRQPATIAAAH